MISSRDNDIFVKDVISTDLLECSIDWISLNLEPDDVFTRNQLETWAKDNGFVEED